MFSLWGASNVVCWSGYDIPEDVHRPHDVGGDPQEGAGAEAPADPRTEDVHLALTD